MVRISCDVFWTSSNILFLICLFSKFIFIKIIKKQNLDITNKFEHLNIIFIFNQTNSWYNDIDNLNHDILPNKLQSFYYKCLLLSIIIIGSDQKDTIEFNLFLLYGNE